MESEPIDIVVCALVRELHNGDCVAAPVGAPEWVAYAEDEEDVVLELELFLREHLADVPADEVAGYVLPEDAWLLELEVELPRPDLPRTMQVRRPMTIPCAVIPDKEHHWVVAIPLDHTFYVRGHEDLEEAAREELRRLVSATQMEPTEYLTLLPAAAQWFERIEVSVERLERGSKSTIATKREALMKRKREQEARALLEEIGDPWHVALARRAPPSLQGRADEVAALTALLGSPSRASVVLVGDRGVGKTALARAVVASPEIARTRGVYATSGARLIAGQSGFGQWQKRLDDVMKAAELLDAALYFDDLSDLFSADVGGGLDMASAMRPYLDESRVRVLGELTSDDASRHERRYVGLFSMLRRVRVEPLGHEDTVEALRERSARRRTRGEPSLRPSAAAALVELCARYLPYEAFPGKATRVEEELCAERMRAGYDAAEGAPLMDADEVYTSFARRTGIPAFLLREDESLRHEQITEHFAARVIGQTEAVGRVADALCVVKARAQPPGKPLATLLFVGPTGVGKTEVAKQLAVFLFGSPDRMARFDMSEYMDATAAGRLIRGVGRQSGELTRRVRDQPFGVVLLDEIEKAHPAVFDLLLQVLGEGRLSDARGETTYFHNAIIVMTSNLGAAASGARPGFGAEVQGERARYGDAVEKTFRPEFVNRLDAVVPFHALGASEIVEVARVALDRAVERVGLAQRGVGLDVSERARAWVARKGYSPDLGARALARCLEDDLLTPASELISKAGGAARNGVVRVTTSQEERKTASLGEHERDGLVVALHGVTAKKGSEALRGLAAISDMRRKATRLRETRWFVEVKGRIEFLLAQLNYGSRRTRRRGASRGSVKRAELLQQHHELSALWSACDEPFRELESYEELAVGALYDGEPFGWMEFECLQVWERFGEHAVRVILALWGNRDVTTLELRAARGPEALMAYVRLLAGAAEARGWRMSFHLAGDSSKEWSGMGYGPPRGPQWILGALGYETHCVLVSVSGPFAGALLDYEEGVHEWRGLPDTPVNEPPLVVVSVVGAKTNYARADFVSKVVPTPPDHERDVRKKRRRLVDMVTGDLSSPTRRVSHVIQAADYFLKYEAMVFDEIMDIEFGKKESS